VSPARRPINDGGRAGQPALALLADRIVACRRCDRLVDYCATIGREKRAAYVADTYWARPVPGFGDPAARLVATFDGSSPTPVAIPRQP
jgi:uracil-DNA glycosylase